MKHWRIIFTIKAEFYLQYQMHKNWIVKILLLRIIIIYFPYILLLKTASAYWSNSFYDLKQIVSWIIDEIVEVGFEVGLRDLVG